MTVIFLAYKQIHKTGVRLKEIMTDSWAEDMKDQRATGNRQS